LISSSGKRQRTPLVRTSRREGIAVTRLLGVLFLVILVVGAVGYYRGWFSVSESPQGFNVTVDKQKLEEDEKKLKEAAEKLKEGAK
jgi:hypothetical protein